MTGCLVGFVALQPLCGVLADRKGHRFNLVAFGIIGALATVPILYGLERVGGVVSASLLTGAGLAITALYTSMCGIAKADMFPAEVRGLGRASARPWRARALPGRSRCWCRGLGAIGHAGVFYAYVTAMLVVAAAIGLRLPARDDEGKR